MGKQKNLMIVLDIIAILFVSVVLCYAVVSCGGESDGQTGSSSCSYMTENEILEASEICFQEFYNNDDRINCIAAIIVAFCEEINVSRYCQDQCIQGAIDSIERMVQ